uniref:Interferon gamma receptor 2 n=1 Tax=Propithecus coquereli TaxID=379532 RepID=A0A2K6EGW5_PROCO
FIIYNSSLEIYQQWGSGSSAILDPLSQLPAPQHPRMRLYNAEQVLSWQPVVLSGSARPVVYRVQFKYTASEWFEVTPKSVGVNCTQITATECDFTAPGLSKGFPMDFNITLRLRAELGELHSAWVTMPWFQHYLNGKKTGIHDEIVSNWVVLVKTVKGPFKSNSILLDDLKPFRVYCLRVEAQLFWTKNIIRPGQLSNISCHETTADASTKLQQIFLISVGTFSLLLALAGACFFLVLKYRGLIKYWFHTPPSIPSQIEEYLKDPAQPILEALDKNSSPKDDAWDSVSIVSFPEKEQEDVLQTL